jgi:hypothetical protein
MRKKISSLFTAAALTIMLVGSALAAEMQGQISKVGNEGREITVKAKDGKEVTVKISGSRTKLEGVSDRAALKEGQNVTVEHEGDEAKKITVKAAK